MRRRARPGALRREGTTQPLNASSGELFFPPWWCVATLICSLPKKAFPSAAAAVIRRFWNAARRTRLWCGSTSPEQREYGIRDSPGSAGDGCNTIPGEPIPANSQAKKRSDFITPALRRAQCILHVISIFWFYQLELFCLQTLKSEQRKA